MLEQDLNERARALLDLCRGKRLKLAAAESCTGGLLAATLTDIPGSSDVFERGFITYSNEAKGAMLGVPSATLQSHGAVSRETAEAMAKGVRTHPSTLRYRSPASLDRAARRPANRSGSCISPPPRAPVG
jgi:nicotinamide-nucleotide amidase